MSTQADASGLWESADVAAYLGVKVSTVKNWAKQGKIPFIRVRSLKRFRKADVVRWTEELAATSRSVEQSETFKLRARARAIATRAKALGEIVAPKECQRCAAAVRLDGHHPDYSQPLAIEWLCR